jgi:tryptophan-rich sensory protein
MTPDAPQKSTATLLVGLIVSIVVCFSAAAIGGFATTSSIEGWYAGINKPTWNPPNWIFGPVWSTLYLMMAVSVWLVWKKSGLANAKFALVIFAIQLVLNLLWSLIFFGMQQPGWAFAEVILLWVSIVMTIAVFFRHSKLAAYLLVPYLLWVSFASFLNYTIWSMN